MEASQDSDVKLFPKAKPTIFKEKQEPFFTNFYKISFKDTFKNIYQFSLVVQPQIPADSLEQIRRITQCAYQQLKKKIQLFSYRGFMLWGFKSLNGKTITQKISFKIKEQQFEYNIFIQQTKALNFLQMQNYPKQANKYLQILNIKIQNEVRRLDYIDLGKGVYTLKESMNKHVLQEFGISICQGFKFTLTLIDKEIYIKIDLHTRIFQIKTVLQIINEELRIKKKTKQELQKYLQGSIVATNYGNFNTYKIKGIQYKRTPKDKFQCAGRTISYYEYYLEKYAVQIKNLDQPLLLVESNLKNLKEDIYIVPEIVSLTGIPNQQIKKSFKFTQQLAKITKIDPETRMNIIENFLDDFSQKQQILKIGDYLQTIGYVLQQPEIKVGKNVLKSIEGKISLRDSKLKDAATFNDWVLIYSLSAHPDQDREETDQIVDTLKRVAKNFGINVQQPGFLQIKGRNVDVWKEKMQQDIKKNGKPQIILIVANPHEQKYYGQFKKWLFLEKNIPSQMVCKKKMLKKGFSVASNVLLQMNVKIGKPIWQIQRKHPYFQKQNVASVGISVSQNLNKKTYTLALVGSLNNKSNEFISVFQAKIVNKAQIAPEQYMKVYDEWFTNYYAKSKKLPSSIIIYRQGLTDPQVEKQIPIEIQAFRKSYANLCKMQKKQFIQPKVIYVIVSKTIDTRFFTVSKNLLKNPKSGSIIPQDPDQKNRYSFYLVPHHVHEGTCTPTNFRIVYDDSQILGDALMRFTFEQCFNYFNWQGAVTVPAVLQYAEKLSGFVAKHIGQNMKTKALCNSLFYI